MLQFPEQKEHLSSNTQFLLQQNMQILTSFDLTQPRNSKFIFTYNYRMDISEVITKSVL